MSRVKTNFFANLAGSGWTALVGLACTPLYIHFMGMEAYGLIGFYFMLQGVIQILDLGLSPTMKLLGACLPNLPYDPRGVEGQVPPRVPPLQPKR